MAPQALQFLKRKIYIRSELWRCRGGGGRRGGVTHLRTHLKLFSFMLALSLINRLPVLVQNKSNTWQTLLRAESKSLVCVCCCSFTLGFVCQARGTVQVCRRCLFLVTLYYFLAQRKTELFMHVFFWWYSLRKRNNWTHPTSVASTSKVKMLVRDPSHWLPASCTWAQAEAALIHTV